MILKFSRDFCPLKSGQFKYSSKEEDYCLKQNDYDNTWSYCFMLVCELLVNKNKIKFPPW